MVVILSIELVDYDNFKTYGALTYDDAIEVTEDLLGLEHEEIGGYQRIGNNSQVRSVNFVIRDQVFNAGNVQAGLNKRTKLSSGKIIVVTQPNREITEVYIKYAPFDWEDERFSRIFSRYGDIKKIEHLTLRSGDTKKKRLHRNKKWHYKDHDEAK